MEENEILFTKYFFEYMNCFDFRFDKLIIWATFIKTKNKKRLNWNNLIERKVLKKIFIYLIIILI